jgi:hypothetical protein
MRLAWIALLAATAAAGPVHAQARFVPMVGFDLFEGATIGLGYDIPLARAAGDASIVVAVRPSAEVTEVGSGRRTGLRLNGDVLGRVVLSGLGFVPYGKLGAVAEVGARARYGFQPGVSYGAGVEVRRAFVEFSGALTSGISQPRVAVGYRL